jgi:serine/threonine-protein kinase
MNTWRMAGWEVLGRLARGSTADVLVARAALSGDETPASLALGLVTADRRVVLKRLYPHLAADEDFVKSFVDEVRLMSLLRHRGIVDVLDLDEDDETCFAVLELVDGPSLSAALRLHARTHPEGQGHVAVDVAVVRAIGARVAEALHVVHTARDPKTSEPLLLVHRDVNPQNILVGRDGAVKLADFGVARSAPGRANGILAARTTNAGVLKGKVSFMSPEQLRGDVVDGRADLFALGATLYVLLTGSLPFCGGSDVELFEAIANHAPPAPSQQRAEPGVSALDDLVMGLLEKDPARRPASADEVHKALSGVEDDVVAAFVSGLGLPSLRA